MNYDKYIKENDDFYYIDINGVSSDCSLAHKLGLTYHNYIEILKKHDAWYSEMGYVFGNKEDIIKVLEELEPNIVMALLSN